MKRIVRAVILVALILSVAGFSTHAVSERNNDQQQPPTQPMAAEQNPIKEEMNALDSALRDIVSAVAVGDAAKVGRAVATTRGAMEKTRAALQAGAVTLPKNPARVKEFLDMDQKLHKRLAALDRASRHNNQREMQRITPLLLIGCVTCHQTFKQ